MVKIDPLSLHIHAFPNVNLSYSPSQQIPVKIKNSVIWKNREHIKMKKKKRYSFSLLSSLFLSWQNSLNRKVNAIFFPSLHNIAWYCAVIVCTAMFLLAENISNAEQSWTTVFYGIPKLTWATTSVLRKHVIEVTKCFRFYNTFVFSVSCGLGLLLSPFYT